MNADPDSVRCQRGSALLRGSLKIALCAAVLGVSLHWLHWPDKIIDVHGREGTLVAEQSEGLVVSYSMRREGSEYATEKIPHGLVARRIPGVRSMLGEADVTPIAIALLCTCGLWTLVAWRWSSLLTGLVVPVRTRDALIWHLQAKNADLLGVGELGSEACRATLAGRHVGGYTGAIVVQVAERCFGLFALLGLLMLAICLIGQDHFPQADGMLHYLTILVISGSGAAVLSLAIVTRMDPTNAQRVIGPRITGFLQTVSAVAKELHRQPILAVKAIALSLAIHISAVLYHVLLAQGLRMDINFLAFMVTVPVVSLAFALPITVAGLGVFEGTMVLLLTSLCEVTAGEVITLCALHRLMIIPSRLLIVGSLWLRTGEPHVRKHSELPADRHPTLPNAPVRLRRTE